MTHEGFPEYAHGDVIPCEEEDPPCQDVTHEPISVCGPTNADAPVVEPRFMEPEDFEKPTTADYPYADQLDLDGDDCDIELCIRPEPGDDTFKVKNRPLRVGFKAESGGGGPGDCRWVVLKGLNVRGTEQYTAATNFLATNVIYGLPTNYPDDWFFFSTDVDGPVWEFEKTGAVLGLASGSCAPEATSLGPSISIVGSVTVDMDYLNTQTQCFPPPGGSLLFDWNYSVQTTFGGYTCIGPGFSCWPNCQGGSCGRFGTGSFCGGNCSPGNCEIMGNINATVAFGTAPIFSPRIDYVFRTNAPFPVSHDNVEDAHVNYNCCP